MATATYADQATIKNSGSFLDRVSVAVAKYAQYILGNNQSTTQQVSWAKSAIQSPLSEAQRIIFFAIWDPAITSLVSPVDPNAISDAAIQAVTENAINNTALKF